MILWTARPRHHFHKLCCRKAIFEFCNEIAIVSDGALPVSSDGTGVSSPTKFKFSGHDTTRAAFCLFRHANYPSQDNTKTKTSFGKINIYKQITQAKLTRVAAPLGGVFITDDAAVMDLILGAALLVCGQIGQKCRGGATGDAQFEGGGAGGDASMQIVDPGRGLEEVGGLVQGHS